MDSWPLAGKLALVTGGARGIGKAIALQLAKRGASAVAITYHSNEKAANATAAEIAALGTQSIAIQTKEALTVELANYVLDQTLEAFSTPAIDILVNNAGVAPLYNMGSITPESFYDIYNTNVLAPLLLIQSTLPVIRAEGSIINITSVGARIALGGPTALYACSKASLEHLTRNLAVTHSAEKNITINSVAPGATDTDALHQLPKGLIDMITEEWTSLKRIGTPEEVADIVCFLAGGGGARWINGHTIAACGGTGMW